jgi:CRP-like cAMP-binding protein
LAGTAEASRILDTLLPESFADRLRPHVRIVHAVAGQSILGFGTPSTEVYFLVKGRAQVALVSQAGREVILKTMGPGALFGELAAIDDRPRSTWIRALSAVELAVVPGQDFREALEEVPAAGMWVVRHLSAQVRYLTDKVFELNVLAVRTRLHCELLRLCLEAGCNAGMCTIEPAPTHAQLAARIGTHREAVTREMRYLAGKNILEQKRPRQTILNVNGLAEIVSREAGDLDVVSLARRGAAGETNAGQAAPPSPSH